MALVEPGGPADVVVDIRPLRVILLERLARPAVLLLAPIVYWWIVAAAPLGGLSDAGRSAMGVFAVCILLWSTEALPLTATSLLALAILPVSGAADAKRVYALFGSEAVFFILAVFMLAAAVMRTGLSTRLALGMLHRFGHSPTTLLATVYLLNAGMSFFMSEHAVAAMNYPIVAEIVRVLGLRPGRSSYARALFLALAWGTTIGGVGTLLGGARAPLALGMAREVSGRSFTFLEWAMANLPVVAILLVVGWLVLRLFFPIDVASVRAADTMIAKRSFALGRPGTRERAVAFVACATLIGWVVGGEQYGLAPVALIATVAIVAFQLVSWEAIERSVGWGIVVMYGGAIVVGAVMNESGAAAWVSERTLRGWAADASTATWFISGFSIVLTELLSNSAVVALVMPVTLGLCPQVGMDPRVMALVVAVPAGLGFTLPIGTPSNAIAYASGYLSVRDMMVPGAILAVASWLTFNLVARAVWPLLGVRLAGG